MSAEKISTKEFSRLTGISVPTLNRWAKQGKFAPAFQSEGQGKPSYYTADQMEPAKALYQAKANPQTFAVIEESKREVNQPADAEKNAEARLGELFNQMPKTSGGNHGNQYTSGKIPPAGKFGNPHSEIEETANNPNGNNQFRSNSLREEIDPADEEESPAKPNPKLEIAAEMGFNKNQVSQFQKLADNPDALNHGENGTDSTSGAPEMPAPVSDTTLPENDATDADKGFAAKEKSEGDSVEGMTVAPAPLILTPPPAAPPPSLPAKKIFSFTELFDVKADAPIYTPDPHLTLDERAIVIREVGSFEAFAAIVRGQELIAAKAQVGHGNWEKWLADKFGWSNRTAQNYMQIARRFGKGEAFRHLAKKSTLDAMLALPEGEEENFIEVQASEGRPIESQSARQIKRSVSEYKAKLQNVDAPAVGNPDKTVDAKKIQPDAQNDSSADFDFPDLDAIPTYKPPIANVEKASTNEWFTPADIIEAARRVMGAIDLDPASCELANQTVKATKFYSVDDNGLTRKWSGCVWLNPPYSKITGTNSADATASEFADKLIESLNSGEVTEAIWLSHNKTDTQWFCRLAELSAAIVFSRKRINFLLNGVEFKGSSLHGQAFMYFGADPDKFVAEFSQFGWAAKFIPPQREHCKAGEIFSIAK